MPKLKLDDEARMDISISHNIKKHQELLQITDLMMAKELGVCRATWIGKRKNPARMTLEEFRRTVRRLKIPEEEIMEGIKR